MLTKEPLMAIYYPPKTKMTASLQRVWSAAEMTIKRHVFSYIALFQLSSLILYVCENII